MRTFLRTLLPEHRPQGRRRWGAQASSEEGFMLLEVIISTLVVAFIAVATFNGFGVVTRVTTDERRHDQAAVLASQAQEQLRSDPASTLGLLEGSPHKYETTVGGTTYKITQEAKLVSDTEKNATCNAASSTQSEHGGNYYRVTSNVTWAKLEKAGRLEVTQSSIITPPTGSALEVDVTSPTAPVAGVTTISNANGGAPLSTSAAGCVTYAGIPSTSANLEVYKLGYITETGEWRVIHNEITIAPNLVKHVAVTLNEGGAILARFTNKGAAATGDTFVVGNSRIKEAEFMVGGTNVPVVNAEGEYEAITGKYEPTATTSKSPTKYPTGDLFPFTSKWSVYAGDCAANNPFIVTAGATKSGEALVTPGHTAEAKVVPTTKLLVNVYQGARLTTPEVLETEPYAIKITNTACASAPTPNNAVKASLEHPQKTVAGHLEDPYQPFGKAKMCLAYNPPSKPTTHRTYTVEYNAVSEEPRQENIYVKETAEYSSPGSGDKVHVAEGQSTC
jgi:type II secretory pathway pseudopilin PulG